MKTDQRLQVYLRTFLSKGSVRTHFAYYRGLLLENLKRFQVNCKENNVGRRIKDLKDGDSINQGSGKPFHPPPLHF